MAIFGHETRGVLPSLKLTASKHLKMDAWNTRKFPFGSFRPMFVSFVLQGVFFFSHCPCHIDRRCHGKIESPEILGGIKQPEARRASCITASPEDLNLWNLKMPCLRGKNLGVFCWFFFPMTDSHGKMVFFQTYMKKPITYLLAKCYGIQIPFCPWIRHESSLVFPPPKTRKTPGDSAAVTFFGDG